MTQGRNWQGCEAFCTRAECQQLSQRIDILESLISQLQTELLIHKQNSIPEAHSFNCDIGHSLDLSANGNSLYVTSTILICDKSATAYDYASLNCPVGGGVNLSLNGDTLLLEGQLEICGETLNINSQTQLEFCSVETCQELEAKINQVELELSNHRSLKIPSAHDYSPDVAVDVSILTGSDGYLKIFTRVDVDGNSDNDSAEDNIHYDINLDNYCTKDECDVLRSDLDTNIQNTAQNTEAIEGIVNGEVPVPINIGGTSFPSNAIPRSATGGGGNNDNNLYCSLQKCEELEGRIQELEIIDHSVELILNGNTLICTVFINGIPAQGSTEIMPVDLSSLEAKTTTIINQITNTVIPSAQAAETKATEAKAEAKTAADKAEQVYQFLDNLFGGDPLEFSRGLCAEVFSSDGRLIGARFSPNSNVAINNIKAAIHFTNQNLFTVHQDVCALANKVVALWAINGGSDLWGNNLEITDYNPKGVLEYYHDLLYNLDTNPDGEETITARNNKDVFASLMVILQHQLGLHNFPERVPFRLSDNDPNNLDTYTTIDNLVDLNMWYYRQFDELIGKFPFEIEVLDNDWTTLGDDGQTIFKVPNIAEALAEITFKQVQHDAAINYQNAIIQRCLLETISSKQVTIKNFYKIETIQDWIGMKLKQIKKKVRFTCNPLIDIPGNADDDSDFTVAKFFAPKEIDLDIEEFDEDINFQRHLFFIMRAVSIIQSAFTDQIPNNDDAGDSLIQKIKAMASILDNVEYNEDGTPKDEFLDFIQKVEDMFGAQYPYGKARANRPRIRKLDGDNPVIE